MIATHLNLRDITLLEVIEAIDGSIQLNKCTGESGTCSFEDNCPIKQVWCDAQDDLVARLRNTKFGQLITQAA